MLVDALQPTLYILEAVLTRDIKHHYHTVALPIKTLSHASKPVLACRVPYFNVDLFSSGCSEGVGVELDTDGGNIILFELFVLIHLEDGGLAHCAITKSD